MPTDPYAVLRALLRAEAARSTPKPQLSPLPRLKEAESRQPGKERRR